MTRKPMTPAQWEAKNVQQREYERKVREREAYGRDKSDAEMDGRSASAMTVRMSSPSF